MLCAPLDAPKSIVELLHFLQSARWFASASADMTKAKENQRNDIEFCVRSGMSRAECITRIQQLHQRQSLSVSSIRRWYSKFQNRCTRIQDNPRSGRPVRCTPAKIQQVQQLLNQDGHRTVRQISANVGLSLQLTHRLLRKDLQVKKKCLQWIPHLLTPAQKLRRIACSRASLTMISH